MQVRSVQVIHVPATPVNYSLPVKNAVQDIEYIRIGWVAQPGTFLFARESGSFQTRERGDSRSYCPPA